MDKIIKIKIFNETIDKLFDYLSDTFPLYKSDVTLSKSSIELIRIGNPRLVIQQFVDFLEPYSDKLLTCDEKFFLNFDNYNNIPKEHILFGLKLKGIWNSSNITISQKAIIWLYFQKLYNIGKDIVS